MKIFIGTCNKVKVDAFLESVAHYSHIVAPGSTVQEVSVDSGVPEQPRSLDETVLGAQNRAVRAVQDGGGMSDQDTGVGIESGLIEVNERLINICVCCIHHKGRVRGFGISSGFEIPPSIANLVREGYTIREASLAAGFTKNENIAHEEGNVGLLTGGRLNRMQYTKQAIMMAFIQLENSEWY